MSPPDINGMRLHVFLLMAYVSVVTALMCGSNVCAVPFGNTCSIAACSADGQLCVVTYITINTNCSSTVAPLCGRNMADGGADMVGRRRGTPDYVCDGVGNCKCYDDVNGHTTSPIAESDATSTACRCDDDTHLHRRGDADAFWHQFCHWYWSRSVVGIVGVVGVVVVNRTSLCNR
jgi:hypothetical protein